MIACLVCYLVVRDQLRGQVDGALTAQQSVVQNYGQISKTLPGIPASAGGPAPYVDVVLANGQSGQYEGNVTLPVQPNTIQVAKGLGGPFFSDANVGRDHLRVLTFHVTFMIDGQPQSAALQLARPLNGVDGVLSKLRLVLLAGLPRRHRARRRARAIGRQARAGTACRGRTGRGAHQPDR